MGYRGSGVWVGGWTGTGGCVVDVIDRPMFASLDVTIQIRCNTEASATDLADMSCGVEVGGLAGNLRGGDIL
jgi:hypothetical protein